MNLFCVFLICLCLFVFPVDVHYVIHILSDAVTGLDCSSFGVVI